jgi:hypothetical protein
MYLTGHTAVAVAVVTALGIKNPVAAFGVGWLSHYVVDFIPHGDEEAGEWAERGKNKIGRIAIILAIDCAVLFSIVAAYVAHRGWEWPAAFAAAGSAVPDVLWGLSVVLKRPFIGPLERLHDRGHNFFNVRMPLWLGLVLQAVVAGSLWAWLIFR